MSSHPSPPSRHANDHVDSTPRASAGVNFVHAGSLPPAPSAVVRPAPPLPSLQTSSIQPPASSSSSLTSSRAAYSGPHLPTASSSASQRVGASKPIKKGILKSSSDRAPPTRLRWDEDNLMITEAQKDAKDKITEPKTPFIHYNIDTDEISGTSGSVPPMELSAALGKAKGRDHSSGSLFSSDSESGRKSGGSDWESTDEEEKSALTEEDREKHERFAKLRAQHYNMRAALTKGRALAEDDSGDEEEGRGVQWPTRRQNRVPGVRPSDAVEDDEEDGDDGEEDEDGYDDIEVDYSGDEEGVSHDGSEKGKGRVQLLPTTSLEGDSFQLI
ncbi:hypothetical protein DFJ73DRAFT_958340 [Zopfochytrium polystomum]|nr:hypothetical protein DFJ73DRAFT_958340 [Zopfochytrium polystomum]